MAEPHNARQESPVRLHFEERGQGRPVVLLHGLFGSSANLRTLVRKLSAALRVINVDLRNHGRSPHVARHDYPSMAGDVLALLDDLQLPQAAVVGHSMGGKVAMELALTQPQRVERLGVLDIAPRSHDGPREVLDALLEVDVAGASSREELDAQMQRAFPDPALRAFLLMGATRVEGDGFTWKFNLAALARNWNAITGDVRTGRYDGPALFLRGEKSDHVLPSDVPRIRERFPRAQVETVPNAGHWLHVDAPDETFEQVRRFLEQGALAPGF